MKLSVTGIVLAVAVFGTAIWWSIHRAAPASLSLPQPPQEYSNQQDRSNQQALSTQQESYDATLSNAYAPTDGPALELSFLLDRKRFIATVWGQGYLDLRSGKPVTIALGPNAEGPGEARLCSSPTDCESYPDGVVTIEVGQAGDAATQGKVKIGAQSYDLRVRADSSPSPGNVPKRVP